MTTAVERQTLSYDAEIQDASIKDRILAHAISFIISLSFFSFFLIQVSQFRQLYSKVINDKHDDVMAKFGAILAQGILDAGNFPNI